MIPLPSPSPEGSKHGNPEPVAQCLLALTLHFSAILPYSGKEEKGAATHSCVEGTRRGENSHVIDLSGCTSITGKLLDVCFF